MKTQRVLFIRKVILLFSENFSKCCIEWNARWFYVEYVKIQIAYSYSFPLYSEVKSIEAYQRKTEFFFQKDLNLGDLQLHRPLNWRLDKIFTASFQFEVKYLRKFGQNLRNSFFRIFFLRRDGCKELSVLWDEKFPSLILF